MTSKLQGPLLETSTLVLVTAANGYIASHIVDQLLHYGYAVRAAVRSASKSSWLPQLYNLCHLTATFDLVEIPDILVPGAYDAALKGAGAVIHTAAFNSLADDPQIIANSINANIALLEAVAKANTSGAGIKRVVFTSSSWVVQYPQPNVAIELSSDSYDISSEAALNNSQLPKEFRGLLTYVTAKSKAEQASWQWMREHDNPGFVLNTVVPSTCFGPVLAPEYQVYPSTAGFVRSLYEGDRAYLFELLEPQWFVDVRDAARLHVAAAVLSGVEGERLFGWAEPYTWIDVSDSIEKEMGRKCGVVIKDKGRDLSTADGPRDRAMELLGRMGFEAWIGFRDAVGGTIRSYYPA